MLIGFIYCHSPVWCVTYNDEYVIFLYHMFYFKVWITIILLYSVQVVDIVDWILIDIDSAEFWNTENRNSFEILTGLQIILKGKIILSLGNAYIWRIFQVSTRKICITKLAIRRRWSGDGNNNFVPSNSIIF